MLLIWFNFYAIVSFPNIFCVGISQTSMVYSMEFKRQHAVATTRTAAIAPINFVVIEIDVALSASRSISDQLYNSMGKNNKVACSRSVLNRHLLCTYGLPTTWEMKHTELLDWVPHLPPYIYNNEWEIHRIACAAPNQNESTRWWPYPGGSSKKKVENTLLAKPLFNL